MNTPERTDRFAQAVALEIQSGNYRVPIWSQAMIVAKGDVQKAKDLYTAMRVQQMEQDEATQNASRSAKLGREQFNDEVSPSRLLSKVLLLGLIALVFVALAYILMNFR